MILKEDIANSVFVLLSFSLIGQKYDECFSDKYTSSVPWGTEIYTISEDDILDFIDRLNMFVAAYHYPPHMAGKKLSEYGELEDIFLVRVDNNTFAVFNKYWREIPEIPGIGIEFKKKEGPS